MDILSSSSSYPTSPSASVRWLIVSIPHSSPFQVDARGTAAASLLVLLFLAGEMALGGPARSLQWMPRDAASPRPLPGPVAPSSLTVCKVAALLVWLHSSPARRSSSSASSSGLSLPPLAPCATFRPSCSWAPAPASVWSGVIPWKQAPRAASLQPRPHHPHWHSRAYSTSIIPLRPLRRRFGAVDLGHGPRYSFVLFLGWPPPSSPLYGAPPPPSGICRSPPVGLSPLPFGRVLPFRVASAALRLLASLLSEAAPTARSPAQWRSLLSSSRSARPSFLLLLLLLFCPRSARPPSVRARAVRAPRLFPPPPPLLLRPRSVRSSLFPRSARFLLLPPPPPPPLSALRASSFCPRSARLCPRSAPLSSSSSSSSSVRASRSYLFPRSARSFFLSSPPDGGSVSTRVSPSRTTGGVWGVVWSASRNLDDL